MVNNTVSRRSFLQGAAALPAVMPEIAGDMEMRLTGLAAGGGEEAIRVVQPSDGFDAVHRVLQTHGMPAWKLDAIREDANHFTRIKPDIAVLRSVSLTRKCIMQRDYNIAQSLDYYEMRAIRERLERAWNEKHKLSQWW